MLYRQHVVSIYACFYQEIPFLACARVASSSEHFRTTRLVNLTGLCETRMLMKVFESASCNNLECWCWFCALRRLCYLLALVGLIILCILQVCCGWLLNAHHKFSFKDRTVLPSLEPISPVFPSDCNCPGTWSFWVANVKTNIPRQDNCPFQDVWGPTVLTFPYVSRMIYIYI